MASQLPAASATPTPVHADSDKPKPRRFLPEPVETSTRSSKTVRTKSPDSKPAEAPKPRRFAPQPIEHSAKSSRNNSSSQEDAPQPRRFAPQVVEESRSSSKDKVGKPGHIRFIPEPIEILHGGNRKARSESSDTTPRPPRKFTPELIDTAQRSRRVGNEGYGHAHDYRTEHGHHLHASEHRRHITGYRTPAEAENDAEVTVSEARPPDSLPAFNAEHLSEARRPVSPYDGSPNPRLAALTQTRSHSFYVPELDTIESSESEPEMDPLSRSSTSERASPITASESSFTDHYKHATRHRESVDESFTHYLLQLEAKKYQERLQEQALAAFPNSDYHEQISHFINDEEDSDDMEIEERPVTWSGFDEEEILQVIRRRESTTVPWEQLEMQRHAERQARERTAAKSTQPQSQSPWWNPVAGGLTMYQPDAEITSMRDRARPPMLGRDLVFPRCPSPEPARFDTTQRSGTVSSISSIDGGSKRAAEPGLWQAAKKPGAESKSPASTVTSTKSPVQGLWGGHCVRVITDDGDAPSSSSSSPTVRTGPTGLMTPQVEFGTNPFERSFALSGGNSPRPRGSPRGSHAVRTPPTPPVDPNAGPATILAEAEIASPSLKEEFPDAFITQVFNYLSLGYPTLARPFDPELSKISGIPVATLRQDDARARASPRGYIRLGPDFEAADAERDGDLDRAQCVRWLALKLYVREWARQERNMVPVVAPGGNWGTGARRGSWAI